MIYVFIQKHIVALKYLHYLKEESRTQTGETTITPRLLKTVIAETNYSTALSMQSSIGVKLQHMMLCCM